MPRLLINRVKYQTGNETPTLFCSGSPISFFRKQYKNLRNDITSKELIAQMDSRFSDPESYIYYTFYRPEDGEFLEISKDRYHFDSYCERRFIIEELIRHFKASGFEVKAYGTGIDFSIFQKIGQFNATWDIYRRIDFLVKEKRKELVFNIGSEQTLISKEPMEVSSEDHISYIDDADSYIRKNNGETTPGKYRILANRDIRGHLGLNNEAPRKFSYLHCFKQLEEFHRLYLLPLQSENLYFNAGGLQNVDISDYFKVSIPENLMLFGKGKTEVNAASGMRDHGPYKTSPKAEENKFIFIYENRDDANQLYFHFKNGLKHFPGLFSYIGVPATLERDISLKYSGFDSLRNEFDNFIADKLPEDSYVNYFVIVIGDFIKHETDEVRTDLYYHIKYALLKKQIPSQFISYKGIRGGSFHYFLPNIAVAILAKLGGVPWRLKTKSQDELVVGFNQVKTGTDTFIGSAVFFSNEGELNKVVGYPATNSEAGMLVHLRNSIESYIMERSTPPERLVIHYYKPNSKEEKKQIDRLIRQELRLNIPFAILEVNDHKSQIDIAFDQEYSFGMPESGTYLKVGRDEYLLFNNIRYQANPIRSIAEELPIKIKIHFADTGGFSHRDLISQVYEFSRLYWKGLKQKSQPVTTLYSKMIAEFESNIDEPLPSNDIINKTPWFL